MFGPDGRRNILDQIDEALLRRLQAASHALPVVERLQDLADDVSGWTVDGVSDKEIDKRIASWLDEQGFGYENWKADMEADGIASLAPGLDLRKLWKVYGIEQWVIDFVRSIAFTDEPIAFLPFSAGFWLEYPEGDPPMLVAVMTPLTDPELAAKQLKKKHKEFFGARAAKANRRDEVEAAKMLQMHRQGMSYREIAIQNLRSNYPDIVEHPTRHRGKIATERDRVAKRITSAEETWKERLGESSTAD